MPSVDSRTPNTIKLISEETGHIMDSLKSNDEITVSQIAIYATLTTIVVSFICVLLYLTCSKRYRLNWFENNLLETAKEDEENAQRSR